MIHYSADQLGSINWYAEAERLGAKAASIDDARARMLCGKYLACPDGRGSGLRFIETTNDVHHDHEGFEYAVRRIGSMTLPPIPDMGVAPGWIDGTRPSMMKPRSIGGKAKLLVLSMAQVRQILVDRFGAPVTDEPAPVEELAADEQDQGILLRSLLAEVRALRKTVGELVTELSISGKGQRALPGVKP